MAVAVGGVDDARSYQQQDILVNLFAAATLTRLESTQALSLLLPPQLLLLLSLNKPTVTPGPNIHFSRLVK